MIKIKRNVVIVNIGIKPVCAASGFESKINETNLGYSYKIYIEPNSQIMTSVCVKKSELVSKDVKRHEDASLNYDNNGL